MHKRKHIVIIAVCVAGGAFLVCAANWLVQQSRKAEIVTSLHEIGVAIYEYRTSGSGKWLPQAVSHGGLRDSWRFALLPFLEDARADAFDAPWKEGPYRNTCHPSYCLTNHENENGFHTTNVLAIVGPGTIAESDWSVFERDAILLLAVADTEIGWGEPGDVEVDERGNVIGDRPEPIDGKWIGVCFANGRVWLLDKDVPWEELELFFTVESAKDHDANEVLGAYKIFGGN